MGWYLNRALTNFRREVNARWPNRDKRSDGTIGDADHQSRDSDHNEDPDGSVDAWDMDVDGVDVQACINAAIRHESIQYIIYNRRITSRSWGLGKWRTYTGSNPHDKHVHFNTRPSHERSTKPWGIKTMTEAEFIKAFLAALKNEDVAKRLRAIAVQYTGGGIPEGMNVLNVMSETLTNTRNLVAAAGLTVSDDQLERVFLRILARIPTES